MIEGKKCIGILTSGGDAPGMNAAIRSVVRSALHYDMIPIGIIRGYNGLLEKNYIRMDASNVSNILKKGGTILFTARCKEFYEEKYRKIAYQNAKDIGLDALIVIGGDGSYNGARYLSEMGLPCIGLPGTIDNDISCTDYTIGYDTAMNTALELIDKLNDTAESHHRCSVVEVMGRHAGHMALNTGIACGAVAIVTEEERISIEEICSKIFKAIERGKHHFIIVVSEGVGGTEQIAKDIENITGIDTRASILGHVQRGGTPTLRDRVMASEMGNYAIKLLIEEKGNRVVAMKEGSLVDYDINEALLMKKGLDKNLLKVMNEIA